MNTFMTKERYEKMTGRIRTHPFAVRLLQAANRISLWLAVAAYATLLIYTFLSGRPYDAAADFLWTPGGRAGLLWQTAVPAVGFFSLSFVRDRINRPRPYEVFSVPPAVSKNTKGHSFPSRHVFSAYMIAFVYLLASPWLWAGILLLLLSTLTAVLRVLCGLHFPRDVAAGFLWAALFAAAGAVLFAAVFYP